MPRHVNHVIGTAQDEVVAVFIPNTPIESRIELIVGEVGPVFVRSVDRRHTRFASHPVARS